MACSLWALRTSGFWFLLAMMSVIVAPVIALWNFVVLRDLFFVISSVWPFLCLRLYSTVQLILRGLRFIRCDFSHFALMNWKACNEVCGNYYNLSEQSKWIIIPDVSKKCPQNPDNKKNQTCQLIINFEHKFSYFGKWRTAKTSGFDNHWLSIWTPSNVMRTLACLLAPHHVLIYSTWLSIWTPSNVMRTLACLLALCRTSTCCNPSHSVKTKNKKKQESHLVSIFETSLVSHLV